MDRFDDMRSFITVVDAGSFTAAADQLGVAKSAVSRRVSALESRLGVQLMRRSTRRLSLTTSGQQFYEHSARLLADLDELESAVAQDHGELRGRLRVALPLSFGLHHMPVPICDFSRLHPNVEFDLDFNDRRVDLVEEGWDMAIRIGDLADSSLVARRLFAAKVVLVASPDYLARRGTPDSPRDLADHACLTYSNLPDPRRWHYDEPGGRQDSVAVGKGMSASSGDFLCRAAVAGLGIAMQPTFIVHAALRAGDVVTILDDYRWARSTGFAVYPPTRHLSHRVRAFIDFLAAHFAGTAPWDREVERAPQ